MKLKLLTLALCTIGSQVIAGEQDMAALEVKTMAKVERIGVSTQYMIVPDAIETESIRLSIIANEIMTDGASVAVMKQKYQLDAAQERALIIVINGSGGGSGMEPPRQSNE